MLGNSSDSVAILTPNLDDDILSGGQGVLITVSFKNVKINNGLEKSPLSMLLGWIGQIYLY